MSDYRNISIRNKRATYDFEILDTYIAGIVLTGTEIKSLRLGKASLTDCYCYFHNGELFVRGMNIAEYHWGTYNNHIPKRDRKLLLNRKELVKLQRSLQDKGLSVVGLKLFINERGFAKLQIGLGKGRKSFDKREYIKERDSRKEIAEPKSTFAKVLSIPCWQACWPPPDYGVARGLHSRRAARKTHCRRLSSR